jgi:tRNA A37 threonylcarbamoyladenosine biosynthesis protein TsaE
MPPIITVKKDYILVEPEEVDYWEIWEGIAKEMSLPEFPEKNDIWIFHEGPVKLTYVDLYRLKDFIEENYPENAIKNKTAIVVESGTQKAIAESFIQITVNLPFKIKAFSDLKSAEDWITKN